MEESNEIYDILLKLIIVGDTGVGKTNIISRYIKNEFSLTTKSTIGVEFGSKLVKKNGKLIKEFCHRLEDFIFKYVKNNFDHFISRLTNYCKIKHFNNLLIRGKLIFLFFLFN